MNEAQREKTMNKAGLFLQRALDPQTLWEAMRDAVQLVVPVHHDILFASPMLGRFPIFGRTLSGYPRSEGYWARLGEIAGAGDVLRQFPELKVARMSDHFDLNREGDRCLYDEFMVPEGWRHCANVFFRDQHGMPLGTLGINRTAEQGDFSDQELADLAELHPQAEAALQRVLAGQVELAHRLSLEAGLSALPLPFLVLDWALGIRFANMAGREALHIWREGVRGARASLPTLELTEDLRETAKSIQQAWEEAVQQDSYEEFCRPRHVIHASHPDISATVRAVLPADGAAFEPGLIMEFQIPTSDHNEVARALAALATLSAAERGVTRLAAAGHDNQEIATALGLSVHTVRAHLRAVFRKLGITTRSRLAPLWKVIEGGGWQNV
jgi:DNA-binding CsgD family transcriptional regulator